MDYGGGVLILLGTVLGALIGLGGGWFIDWRHRKWEQRLRKQDARGHAFVAMASAPLLVSIDAGMVVTASRSWGVLRLRDQFGHVRDSMKATIEAASEVFIYATRPETIRAAQEILAVCEHIGELMARREGNAGDWERDQQRMSDARMNFIKAARKELEIEGDFDELFPFDGETQTLQRSR